MPKARKNGIKFFPSLKGHDEVRGQIFDLKGFKGHPRPLDKPGGIDNGGFGSTFPQKDPGPYHQRQQVSYRRSGSHEINFFCRKGPCFFQIFQGKMTQANGGRRAHVLLSDVCIEEGYGVPRLKEGPCQEETEGAFASIYPSQDQDFARGSFKDLLKGPLPELRDFHPFVKDQAKRTGHTWDQGGSLVQRRRILLRPGKGKSSKNSGGDLPLRGLFVRPGA